MCALLALVFIVVPGPSVIFLLGGLLCLSINYSWARNWLRKTQTAFKNMCVKLDHRLR
ncbi:PGPGW domain-containing protein [Pseudoalteromonas sp. DL2-H2.2]|uniref:PGPGW domain-containing protein n=1 Tax=Pseudoalteromonas sp. DL2-H2.2 TaxID=2908889 RepID=UPI001F271B87|nr:PGPGW domain-containing protein [Pseudoalteromonas sp. DL2-H2.2]MCF2906940.1 PGPGW domain-containing protein [Pseudoalteromonas sp. DL2-H2.2]